MNILQTLSRLHPYVIKQQKHGVLLLWLRFYEIFTRHPDINSGIKHLTVLRTLIEQGPYELGQCALEIIRNMAFNGSNRTSLLASGKKKTPIDLRKLSSAINIDFVSFSSFFSDDFLYTMKLALDSQSAPIQLLAITSIWKLISHNSKGRHVIKHSILYNKLLKLNESIKYSTIRANVEMDDDAENQEDLRIVLDCVTKILST